MKRIEEFEGLRGLLAMWVFFSHIVVICGYPWASFPQPFNTLITGSFAVDVFMILSGFVVSMLITVQKEPYLLFITRRLIRLYPLYLICTVIALVLNLLGIMPRQYHDEELVSQIILHLIMLHGVAPEMIIHNAPGAFLDTTWSISTEWQFYLLIPLFFAAFKRYPIVAWIGLVMCAIVGCRSIGLMKQWNHPAFLPFKLYLFTLGTLCYYLFTWVEDKKESLRNIGRYIVFTSLAFAFIFVSFSTHFGLFVWIIAFGSLLAVRIGTGTPIDCLVSSILRSKPVQWLGLISYSIYLSHVILIFIVIKILKYITPDISNFVLLTWVTLLAIPSTLATSSILYWKIERPAILFGKRFSNSRSRLYKKTSL